MLFNKQRDGHFLLPQTNIRVVQSTITIFGYTFDTTQWKNIFLWTCVVAMIVLFVYFWQPGTETVTFKLEPDEVFQTVSDDFLSLALDTSLIRERWVHLNISSTKFLRLTKYLSPGYLRIGGTSADRLIFKADSPDDLIRNTKGMSAGDQPQDSDPFDVFLDGGEWAYDAKTDGRIDISNFTMTGHDFLMIYNFSKNAGFKLLFDLNVLLRDGEDWDSANAMELIKFANDHQLDVNWQLGNEPNSFRHVFNVSVSGEQLGRDFDKLKSILEQFPRYKNALLVGPDITRPRIFADPALEYLTEFLASANDSINAVTWHQYYLNGRTATEEDFLSPSTLNVLYEQAYAVKTAVANASLTETLPIWLSETGSAYGGGATQLSNRFIAGFLWLDKLGVAARMGIHVVIRQTLYHGFYSLLEDRTMNPLPDWWLSLVFKTFVGHRVIKGPSMLGHVRLYCHCTPEAASLRNGTVTVYGMNLLSLYATISVEGLPKPIKRAVVHAYVLTGERGLHSKYAMMNWERLALNKDGTLPPFKPKIMELNAIYMPPHSIGFFVLHGIEVPACQQ